MLTDKERMELLNLRKRVVAQKEEIKRLEVKCEYQRQMHEAELDALRSRCYPTARDCFDNHQWGLLKIVTVKD